jgi:ribosomal protein S18 acetylase RimI-like enzyme
MGKSRERGIGAVAIEFRDLGPEEIEEYIKFDAKISWDFLTDEEKMELGYEGYLRRHREVVYSLYRANMRNRMIAAYADGEIVGVVWVGMRVDTVHFVDVGYIYDIEVIRDLRGKGIGSKLLQMAEETCREWGVKEVMLAVEANNFEAIKWYERMGYAPKRYLMSKRLRAFE